MTHPARQRFHGQIAGFGSASGTRVVIGHWTRSPFGSFTDAMVETGDGHRLLLAPTADIATFVAQTYTFDDVRILPITAIVTTNRWDVESPTLRARFDVGARTPLGLLLRPVPVAIATAPRWARLIGPVAARIVPGVRTVGTARAGRIEYYGATDNRAITRLVASLDNRDLGALAPVRPPCRFGFSSTPARPSVTTVTTTIDPAGGRRRSWPLA